MIKFKIYTTDKKVLEQVAKDFQIELVYLKEHCGEGYVSDGKYLRVFCSLSYVDISTEMKDMTHTYLGTYSEEQK